MVEVTLTITSPDGTTQVPLAGEAVTIGRTSASTIAIASDAGLSRRHITVHRSADRRVYLTDEGSTNGSYLNGEPVPPGGAALSDADEIRIGHHTVITVSVRRSGETQNSAAIPATQLANSATPAAAAPSMLRFLIPAVAVAVIILGAVGFGLYRATRDVERRGGEVAVDATSTAYLPAPEVSPARTHATAAAPSDEAASEGGGNQSALPPPSPDVSITSPEPEDLLLLPAAGADASPAGATRKLYRSMSEEEQKEFIKQRAQHIALMMGKRPYALTPDALVHIKFWLDAFARRVGNGRRGLWGGDTIAILERGKTHAPLIIRAFKEHRVPPVVGLYIPFIETEYTNIATNNFAGAAGLFQFLGPTAEHYGVPRAERTDVAKMAPAAARYFRDNIMSFGDDAMSVALSIAGYNRAPESVKRDLRNVLNAKNNEDKERSFWTLIANQGKLDEYFQRENINYVPRFFAAAILGETPWAFGIDMRPLSTYTQTSTPVASASPLSEPSPHP